VVAYAALELRMTHITGVEPSQILLFPEAADDYDSADNPVRFIDALNSLHRQNACGLNRDQGGWRGA
jgi:hypothetical protein